MTGGGRERKGNRELRDRRMMRRCIEQTGVRLRYTQGRAGGSCLRYVLAGRPRRTCRMVTNWSSVAGNLSRNCKQKQTPCRRNSSSYLRKIHAYSINLGPRSRGQ